MGVACRSSLVVSFHEEEGTFVRNIFSCDLPLSPLFFFCAWLLWLFGLHRGVRDTAGSLPIPSKRKMECCA
jgi:hypothetical protein